MVVPLGVMIGIVEPVVLAPFGMAVGVVGPVVFGTFALFGKTVLAGGVTALGFVFGNTVRLEFTDDPLLGVTTVFGVMTTPVPEVFGVTVAPGPEVGGATVEPGPVVGAIVAPGPVKTLGLALVGFCALAAPLGWMVGARGTEPCRPDCVRQAGRCSDGSIMQLVPGANVAVWAIAPVTAPVLPRSSAANPMRIAGIVIDLLLPIISSDAAPACTEAERGDAIASSDQPVHWRAVPALRRC
jgi:hypothetical protein